MGVISDTHGRLRSAAVAALAGSELIVHAGDVGEPGVLEELRRIAPVHAVRGNVDHGPELGRLPRTQTFEVGGRVIHVLHILEELDVDPASAGFAAVIYGHTHVPAHDRRDGVLYLNPGSAGPRRFRLPVSLARMSVGPEGIEVRHVDLPDG